MLRFSSVLPKFEVTLTGPKQLERDDDFIEVVVEARYTFGENVAGRVKLNATLTSSQRGESLAFFDQTASLVSTLCTSLPACINIQSYCTCTLCVDVHIVKHTEQNTMPSADPSLHDDHTMHDEEAFNNAIIVHIHDAVN